MTNFWDKLKNKNKPIYVLAPMAGFTDSAFRQICKSFGADVVYSEMASATALVYNPEKTLEMLEFDKVERPYVVQLFGSQPKHFEKAVKVLTKRSDRLRSPAPKLTHGAGRSVQTALATPDGVDINFGCPVKKVQRQGAGAVLMNDLKLSREIIESVINSTNLPVSIKIRSKVGCVNALRFLDNVSDLDIKAVMIHGRTLPQGFSGPVDTEIIKKARDCFGGVILANGGVKSYDDAMRILKDSKADGVGIARGALGRPWIFKAVRTGQSVERSKRPIFKIALKHARLVKKNKGKQGIIEMRKHLCWYVHNLPGAKKLREKLVKVETIKDIEGIFKTA